MTVRRRAIWVSVFSLALLLGLWGRHRILRLPTEPEPIDLEAYRAYGGDTCDVLSSRPLVPAEWLGGQAGRSEIESLPLEARVIEKTTLFRRTPLSERYEAELLFLLQAWQRGDEYRHFCSPEWTWMSLCGREGIALMRDGKAVAGAITGLN